MSVEKVKEKYPKWEDTSEFYTWQQVWTMVITRPSTATFEEILRDPQANADRGYKWVFWTGLSVFVITFLFLATRFGVFDIPSLLCMLAVGAILPTIAFALSSAITQFFAKLLGGTGRYNDFHYAYAALWSPMVLINLTLIPFTSSLSLTLLNAFLSLYQFMLTAMALRAVNQFGWFKAVAALMLQVLFWMMCGMILGYFLLNRANGTGMAF